MAQPAPWDGDKNRAVSKADRAGIGGAAGRTIVNALPLDKAKLKSVAVVGPLADSVHWGLVRRLSAL
ncbi:MAG: hypothetical protein WDN06_18535 [Asticcacaulis sp.]